MKTRTLIIALVISAGILTACTDKKKAKKEAQTEVTTKEIKKPVVEDSIDKNEKRRLDSLQQVKEHGHAH